MVARRSGAVAFGGDQVAHAGGVEFDLGLGCGEKADRLASGQHRLAPAPDLDRRLPILRVANLGEDRFEFVVCLFVGHGLGLLLFGAVIYAPETSVLGAVTGRAALHAF